MAGHLLQHNKTARHKDNAERQSTRKQQFLAEAFSNKEVSDPFAEELCDALVAANIPFQKLTNPSLNHFLSKYCRRNIPDESTLRKNYLKVCYRKV
jgi:Mg-chelatase subunit ChlD